jgi:hypothetical protein
VLHVEIAATDTCISVFCEAMRYASQRLADIYNVRLAHIEHCCGMFAGIAEPTSFRTLGATVAQYPEPCGITAASWGLQRDIGLWNVSTLGAAHSVCCAQVAGDVQQLRSVPSLEHVK